MTIDLLIVRGPFRGPSGYDHHVREFVRELHNQGLAIQLVDLPSWPSAHRPHAYKQEPFTAPTLDLNVAFHRPTSEEDWLLCDGAAPVSTGGLFGWTARIWASGGALHASGGGQCIYRRMAPSS